MQSYDGDDPRRRKQVLMDAIVLTIFTYGPVDRVGVIRKLRINETLKRKEDGSWEVDLMKAMRSHKSARYHGGTTHTLPALTWPLIDELHRLTNFDLVNADKCYLFYTVRTGDAMRPITEGPFGSWVKGLFAKYAGTPVVPKNLRSIFIVWLKDQDDASDKILAASATAMRHHVNTQSSLAYDIESNNRQIALANEFASTFAMLFQPTPSPSGEPGGSGAVHSAVGRDDGEGWSVVSGFWLATVAPKESQTDDAKRLFHLVLPVAVFTSFHKDDQAKFNAPGGGSTTVYVLPTIPPSGALRFPLKLDARMATGVTVSITEVKLRPVVQPAVEEEEEAEEDPAAEVATEAGNDVAEPPTPEAAAGEPAADEAPASEPVATAGAPAESPRIPKRIKNKPARLDLGGGAASRWKSPRAMAPVSAPTPMTNEFATGNFSVGDEVEAMGMGPGGHREWFKATLVKIRPSPAWPPLSVKYTSTLSGVTLRLALPQPAAAYCHADDVRRVA